MTLLKHFRSWTKFDWERAVFFALLCAMAAANLTIGDMPVRSWHPGNDFLSFYAGGSLAFDERLYDASAIRAFQQKLGWDSPALAFIRLPFYAAMLWPLGQFSYNEALRVWMYFNFACIGAFWWLSRAWSPVLWTIAATLASFPVSVSFIGTQDLPLIVAVLCGFWWLHSDDRHPVWAGLLLSLCSIKFHLFLTLPLYLVRRRDWRVLYGLGTGLLILIAVSFVVQGPGWPQRYIAQVLAPSVSPHGEAMPNWHGAFSAAAYSMALEFVAAAGTAAVAWFAAGQQNRKVAFAATLIAGLLTSHHAYIQDGMILIPMLLALLQDQEVGFQTRLFSMLCLCPVLWVLPMVPGLTKLLVGSLVLLLFSLWDEGHRPARLPQSKELETVAS